MSTKYPIVLVHGVIRKHFRTLSAFGKIGDILLKDGHSVFIAELDGMGCIETNAEQLKKYVKRVLQETGAEKVNLIGYSKGGLDSKYMITELDMEDNVASLTTLCTPHRGSIVASRIWHLPSPIKKFIASVVNLFYRKVFHDEHPDALKTCEQLSGINEAEETLQFSYKVYCQSYSTTIHTLRDCFIMALPMKLQHHFEVMDSDGLVSEESAQFGCYRGKCLDIPVSHVQIVDFFPKKHHKERIYEFYCQLCRDLSEMGF